MCEKTVFPGGGQGKSTAKALVSKGFLDTPWKPRRSTKLGFKKRSFLGIQVFLHAAIFGHFLGNSWSRFLLSRQKFEVIFGQA